MTGPDLVENMPTGDLMIQLLEWIAARPRSYAEIMEAWRTSCLRLPVWAGAVDGGLIEVAPNLAGTRASIVRLTDRGRHALAQRAP